MNTDQATNTEQIPQPDSSQQPVRDSSVTPLGANGSSKGNVDPDTDVPRFENVLHIQTEEGTTSNRRSNRSSKLPARLNDYVLDGKVRYGLNKYVNHSVLSAENCYFVSNLNKSS